MGRKRKNEIEGFGERLGAIMRVQKMSDQELANKVGVARKTILSYRNGITSPDCATLCRMCTVLGTSTEYLFGMKRAPLSMRLGLSSRVDDLAEFCCDKCVHTYEKGTQEELDEKCKKCRLNDLVNLLEDTIHEI